MNRVTFTLDENGDLVRICADEAVEVLIISPSVLRDRNYRWSSLRVGKHHVDKEIDGWPIGDKDTMLMQK
jgi:hypothetical protein